MVIYFFYTVENNVEKEENAGYQHFILEDFLKSSFKGSLKIGSEYYSFKTK